MNLPDLALQIVYGRLAWGLVIAALLLAVLPAARPRTKLLIMGACVALTALPGAASPAYWLALAFQYPSGLLTGFCIMALRARWQGRPARFAMRRSLALGVAAVGLVLYLDTFGVLALGLYYGGFSPVAAPLLACAAAIGFAINVWRGHANAASAAMLIAVLLFSLLRLPTGNLWDALLDPLLWSWSLGSVLVAAMRMLAARRRQAQAAPELASAAVAAAATATATAE